MTTTTTTKPKICRIAGCGAPARDRVRGKQGPVPVLCTAHDRHSKAGVARTVAKYRETRAGKVEALEDEIIALRARLGVLEGEGADQLRRAALRLAVAALDLEGHLDREDAIDLRSRIAEVSMAVGIRDVGRLVEEVRQCSL